MAFTPCCLCYCFAIQTLLQIRRYSPDDPLNLQSHLGGQVVGQGGPSSGVAVVDSGYTAAAADQAGSEDVTKSSSRSANLGPGPVAEAKEDHQQQVTASSAAVAADGQAAAAAAAPPMSSLRISSMGEGSRHGGTIYHPLSNDDEEASLDVVSVGLRSSRMRSHQALGDLALSGANALSAGGTAGTGDGTTAQAGGRSVTFSDSVLARAASGRGQLPSPIGAAVQSSGNVSSLLQSQMSAHSQLSTEGSLNMTNAGQHADGLPGSAAAAGGAAAGPSHSRHRSSSMPTRRPGSSGDGSAAAAGSSSAAPGATSSAAPSAAAKHGVPRARSFHGVSSGGFGGVGSGGGDGLIGLATSGRSSTAYSELEAPVGTAASLPCIYVWF